MTEFGTVTEDVMPPATAAARPMVLIDGVPELGLAVQTYEAHGVLDRRHALVAAVDPALWARRDTLGRQRAVLALPHALADGSSRWNVLLCGALKAASRSRRAGEDERTLELVDESSSRLDGGDGAGWAVSGAGLVPDRTPRLAVGSGANRSRRRYPINGRSVYVLEAGGEAWTLGEALETIAAFAGVGLVTDLLPAQARAERLPIALDLRNGWGAALEALLASARWRVQTTYRWTGGQVRGIAAVVPAASGARFTLPWRSGGAGSAGGSRVASVKGRRHHDPPRRWVMRGDRPRVEATLELVPGWDPALGGLADTAYGRTTSSDFSQLGAVYRHWVLNEDGAYARPPFSQPIALDLRAFFADDLLVPSPTPVGACLVRDASGRRVGPVVEVSTDNGVSWSRYAGEARVMGDRAGVVLDDATLPGDVLSSAKSGTLRVRLTGTLTSPRRLERTRWRGNPFAGAGLARVIEQGAAYRWDRVDASSIHAPSLAAGELSARVVDDRVALDQALLERVLRAGEEEEEAWSGRVTLVGAWPTLGVGDRLVDLGGPGLDAAGIATAVSADAASVASVRVRFGSGGAGPVTRLEVASSGR